MVWDQTEVEFDAQLRAALGENAVAGLREFEATKTVRNIADSLALICSTARPPLSAAEVEQFVDAITAVARTPT